KEFLNEIFLWGPAAAAFAMYAIVFVEPRYVGGFLILLCCAAFGAIRISHLKRRDWRLRIAKALIFLSEGFQIATSIRQDFQLLKDFRESNDWNVVQYLQSIGMKSGDRVAFLGNAIGNHYWAHLGGIEIVAEVAREGTDDYWNASPDVQREV